MTRCKRGKNWPTLKQFESCTTAASTSPELEEVLEEPLLELELVLSLLQAWSTTRAAIVVPRERDKSFMRAI